MEETIQIGADEIILWLKKNKKAEGMDNINLGKKILTLIESRDIGGGKLEGGEDKPTLWSDDESREKLPKTAQQYTLPIDSLPTLYMALQSWE